MSNRMDSRCESSQVRVLQQRRSDLEKANRRAKQLAVQRHLRIAKQYIDNVVLGEFPKLDTTENTVFKTQCFGNGV
jgi:hypothetical protein